MSAALAPQLDSLSKGVADSTRSTLLGNLTSNGLASVGGALLGGSAGAFTAANADLYIPSLYAPAFETIAFGATVTGWAADFVTQLARPDPGAYVTRGFVDLALEGISNKYPLAGPVITEFGQQIKNTSQARQAADALNNAVGSKK